jgi:integrase
MANSTFIAGGRRRRLVRRKHGGTWHVRFQVNGKDVLRSLGTTLEHVARDKAKQIIEAELNGDMQTSRKLKVKSDYSTLQQVVAIFLEKFGTDARRRKTAMGCINALARIVKTALSRSLEDARTSVLTGELIRKYETEKEKLILRDQYGFIQESETRVRASILSEVGNARSIFALGRMNWYDKLMLPDLASFRHQSVKRPEHGRPQRLDEGVMEAIDAAAPELARTNPRCYIAHLLFKFCGMRNSEIRAARRTWIRWDPDRKIHKLGIIYRPDEGFKPKQKTEREIPIAPAVMQEIEKYWTPSPDGNFIVPATHKSERYDIVDREHNAWVGQWIKGRTKVSYELRRYAGWLIYKKTKDITVVQKFLGHSRLDTTMEWYFYNLDETPALDLSDFAPGPSGDNVIWFDKK